MILARLHPTVAEAIKALPPLDADGRRGAHIGCAAHDVAMPLMG
jgi:hypothetical protein